MTTSQLPTLTEVRQNGRATLGNATISFDGAGGFNVWAPGHSIRTTRSFNKALDLLVGLA